MQNPRVIPHSDGSGQVDHVVEVAFGAKIDTDVELLKMGGSIAAYATDNATPKIPLWLMAFKNIRLFFLGSEDFPKEAKISATQDLNAALQRGWQEFEIAERIPLSEIARAHELAEHSVQAGVLLLSCEPASDGPILRQQLLFFPLAKNASGPVSSRPLSLPTEPRFFLFLLYALTSIFPMTYIK